MCAHVCVRQCVSEHVYDGADHATSRRANLVGQGRRRIISSRPVVIGTRTESSKKIERRNKEVVKEKRKRWRRRGDREGGT